jgi:hypothetical protein
MRHLGTVGAVPRHGQGSVLDIGVKVFLEKRMRMEKFRSLTEVSNVKFLRERTGEFVIGNVDERLCYFTEIRGAWEVGKSGKLRIELRSLGKLWRDAFGRTWIPWWHAFLGWKTRKYRGHALLGRKTRKWYRGNLFLKNWCLLKISVIRRRCGIRWRRCSVPHGGRV